MTRRSTLKLTLLRNVSGAALTVGVWTSPCREAESSDSALSLLARFGIWLRLIFGLHSERYDIKAAPEPDYNPSRHQKRAETHRRKRHISGRKHPAHDLEMLMCFAPGSRRGLTLNQYRERFTRISVMGRTQIYARLFMRRLGNFIRARCSLIHAEALSGSQSSICQDPLRPD